MNCAFTFPDPTMLSSRTLPRLAASCLVVVGAAACSDSPSAPGDLGDLPPVQEAKKDNNGKGNGGGGPDKEDGGGDTGSTSEEFETLDPARWVVSDKQFYDTRFHPDHVTVSDGFLHLTTPAGTYDGGEIMSVETFRLGTYEARIKASTAPGSLTAFFLYEFSDRNIDEIDIEIVPDYNLSDGGEGEGLGPGGPHIIVGTYLRSDRTNEAIIPASDLGPDFDIGEFHTYTVATSRKRIAFYVDGMMLAEFTKGIPTARMHIMASTWFPRWLERSLPAEDHEAVFDWIRW